MTSQQGIGDNYSYNFSRGISGIGGGGFAGQIIPTPPPSKIIDINESGLSNHLKEIEDIVSKYINNRFQFIEGVILGTNTHFMEQDKILINQLFQEMMKSNCFVFGIQPNKNKEICCSAQILYMKLWLVRNKETKEYYNYYINYVPEMCYN